MLDIFSQLTAITRLIRGKAKTIPLVQPDYWHYTNLPCRDRAVLLHPISQYTIF